MKSISVRFQWSTNTDEADTQAHKHTYTQAHMHKHIYTQAQTHTHIRRKDIVRRNAWCLNWATRGESIHAIEKQYSDYYYLVPKQYSPIYVKNKRKMLVCQTSLNNNFTGIISHGQTLSSLTAFLNAHFVNGVPSKSSHFERVYSLVVRRAGRRMVC